DNSEFEAQRQAVELQKLQSIQQDHERSLAAADQKVQMITQVRAQTMQRQADATKLREEALSDRAAATGSLMAQFNEVAQAYETTAVAALERAMAVQAQAVEELGLAGGDAADAAGGPTRQDGDIVDADLVGKLLDRVYVLSEYASVAGEFG